jgi:hypothetical protein
MTASHCVNRKTAKQAHEVGKNRPGSIGAFPSCGIGFLPPKHLDTARWRPQWTAHRRCSPFNIQSAGKRGAMTWINEASILKIELSVSTGRAIWNKVTGSFKIPCCVHLRAFTSVVRWLQSNRSFISGALVAAALCPAGGLVSAREITLHSDNGHFTVRISGIEHPERTNRMHNAELLIMTGNGSLVGSAAIALGGLHLYALNPLPTSPRVTARPQHGRYVVEGLRFHVPGEWRLVFDIIFEHIRDRVTLDVLVK